MHEYTVKNNPISHEYTVKYNLILHEYTVNGARRAIPRRPRSRHGNQSLLPRNAHV